MKKILSMIINKIKKGGYYFGQKYFRSKEAKDNEDYKILRRK